ncbi:hypothetical protein [Streptomyces sp. NPDC020141]|uniref:hypothetical protein n=1 Tax=Streptomyces sp. NPDC020141 TaxID=3365065 RepID=UPI0037BC8A6C
MDQGSTGGELMVVTFAELAADPKGPAVSQVLHEAATYADEGPIDALLRASYGSTTYVCYALVASLEQSIAFGYAVVAAGRMLDPAICPEYPRTEWEAERLLGIVGRAHVALTEWAEDRSADELHDLFRATGDDVRREE